MLIFAGYALSTLTKPLFAIASGAGLVFGARFLDRTGKGIRGAPRDALIADVTPPEIKGAAYGLRQSLDTVGAFLGPLLAMGLMMATSDNFRCVFWVAVIPGVLAVTIIVFFIKDPPNLEKGTRYQSVRWHDLLHLGSTFWLVVLFGAVFTLARFSEAFLLLRAENVGITAGMIPLLLVIMNVFYFLTAYPVGRLSDRLGRTGLLATGVAVLIVADLTLCFAKTGLHVAAGTALWGLHMGLTQGILAAMIADTAPSKFRGSAFGIFSMASGIAMLISCLIAGWLWDAFGASATFLSGACFALLALMVYLFARKRLM